MCPNAQTLARSSAHTAGHFIGLAARKWQPKKQQQLHSCSERKRKTRTYANRQATGQVPITSPLSVESPASFLSLSLTLAIQHTPPPCQSTIVICIGSVVKLIVMRVLSSLPCAFVVHKEVNCSRLRTLHGMWRKESNHCGPRLKCNYKYKTADRRVLRAPD